MGLKRLLCIVILLSSPFLAFSQNRAAVTLMILPITGGEPEQAAFFRENLETEIRTAGYTLVGTLEEAIYSISGVLGKAEDEYTLRIGLNRVAGDHEIVSMTLYFTELTETYQVIPYLLWSMLANAPPPPEVTAEPAPEIRAEPAPVSETTTTAASAPVPENTAAAPDLPTRYFSFGLGGEANLVTISGMGTGLTGAAEYRINRLLGAGVRVTVSYDWDEIGALEMGAFARLYFLQFRRMQSFLSPPRILNPFLELDIGAAVLEQKKANKDPEFRTEILAGLLLGLQIKIKHFYLEPYVRGGFPFLAGGGLILGYSQK